MWVICSFCHKNKRIAQKMFWTVLYYFSLNKGNRSHRSSLGCFFCKDWREQFALVACYYRAIMSNLILSFFKKEQNSNLLFWKEWITITLFGKEWITISLFGKEWITFLLFFSQQITEVIHLKNQRANSQPCTWCYFLYLFQDFYGWWEGLAAGPLEPQFLQGPPLCCRN